MTATGKRKKIQIEFEVGHESVPKLNHSGTHPTHNWRVFVQGRNGNDDIIHCIRTVAFETPSSMRAHVQFLHPFQIRRHGSVSRNISIELRLFEEEVQRHTILYRVNIDCPFQTIVKSFAFIGPSEEQEKLMLQAGGVVTWVRDCGGYEATACGTVDRGLMECNICLLLLRDPAQLFCGHVFCRSCLDKHIKEKEESQNVAGCPSCRETIDLDKIFEDKNLARSVLSVHVQCTFWDACRWTGELRDFDGHVNTCPFGELTCIFCKQVYLRQGTEEHRNMCIHWPLDCPNSCGERCIARRDIESHIEVCPDAPKVCPFKDLGCSFTGIKKSLDEHLSTEVNTHLNLTVQNVHDCKQRIYHLEKECNKLKKQVVNQKVIRRKKNLLVLPRRVKDDRARIFKNKDFTKINKK